MVILVSIMKLDEVDLCYCITTTYSMAMLFTIYFNKYMYLCTTHTRRKVLIEYMFHQSSAETLETGNSAYNDDGIYEEIQFTGGKKSAQNSAMSPKALPSLPPPTDLYEEVGSSGGLTSVQNSGTSSPAPPSIPLHATTRVAVPNRSLPPLPQFPPTLPVPMSNPFHKGKSWKWACARYILAKEKEF